MEKNEKLAFRGTNTQIAKGVAVLLLLWHHLRFGQLVENPVPSGFGVLVAFYGKVCVAIFLVLSGYGLWMSYNKKRPKYVNFLKTKIPNLMMPYWISFIIFGILGALFFNRTVDYLYGGSIFDLVVNFLGLNMYFQSGSMNDAWWFISLILLFYVLFPPAFALLDKIPPLFIVLSFASVLWRSTYFVVDWIFPFTVGMIIAKYDLFVKVKQRDKFTVRLVVELVLLAMVMYIRYLMTIHTYYSYLKTDGFIAVLIIQIMFELYEHLGPANKALEYLGNHSYNIYLTHSFFMSYFFWDFTYMVLPEWLGYLFVLGMSILSSYMINFLDARISKLWKKPKAAK